MDTKTTTKALLPRPQTSLHNVKRAPIRVHEDHGELVTTPSTTTLVAWAQRYLEAEVDGIQAPNTFDAKRRDLSAFIRWFLSMNGHAEMAEWHPRDTTAFLEHLERELGRTPATVNRHFATLRRFARWAHEQNNAPFLHGLPTRGAHERQLQRAQPKRLAPREIHALLKAADALVDTENRKDARPQRNRALLHLLYRTGLRVSELAAINLDQYRDHYLHHLPRKGHQRTEELYVPAEARRALDDYLQNERPLDDPDGNRPPLLLSTRGPRTAGRPDQRRLSRNQIRLLLEHIAQEASKHRADKLTLHPHQLRHTFGWEYMQRTKSESATADALGHASTKYTGWYIGMTREEKEAVMESIGDGRGSK